MVGPLRTSLVLGNALQSQLVLYHSTKMTLLFSPRWLCLPLRPLPPRCALLSTPAPRCKAQRFPLLPPQPCPPAIGDLHSPLVVPHLYCEKPWVFCDVKVNARPFAMYNRSPWRHSRGDVPPERPNRGLVPILETLQKGNFRRLQAILNTMSVFVLARNQANIPPQPPPFNEASTAKLEFQVKNRQGS